MPRKQYAANFYAGASAPQIEGFLQGFDPPELSAPPVAGLVPHAGWFFSGAVAAKVFQTIKQYCKPRSFILFGTVHGGPSVNGVYAGGSWATPFGEVLIDEELADLLLENTGGILEKDESAHVYEHSIEVQMPFLKYFFPDAMAVPISAPPIRDATEMGTRVGAYLRDSGANAIVLGTTDLTHYGARYDGFTPAGTGPTALDWMKKNDSRIVKLASDMKAEEIIPEAVKSRNACGPGAMAATVAAASALGSESGLTIEYTTSYDVAPEKKFDMGVGYVGMVFCGS